MEEDFWKNLVWDSPDAKGQLGGMRYARKVHALWLQVIPTVQIPTGGWPLFEQSRLEADIIRIVLVSSESFESF